MHHTEDRECLRRNPSRRQGIVEGLLFLGGASLLFGGWQGALTLGVPTLKTLARQIGFAPVNALLTVCVALLACLLFVWLLRRLQPELSVLDWRGGQALPELSIGAGVATGISIVAVAIAVAVTSSTTWRFAGTGFWITLPWVLLHNLGVALYEELVFRGYLPQLLSSFMRPWLAMTLSTVSWALLHAAGSHSFVAICNIALLGGLLTLSRLRTGRLWGAVGMHWFWNLCLLGLFTTSSGWMEPVGLVRWPRGSWAVGADGLESSGITLILMALLVGSAAYNFLANKKGGVPQ